MAYLGKRPGDTFPSDNAITTSLIADNAVSAVKIAENAITSRELAANTIATGNIADNAVDGTKIAQNSILTRHIDDNQITADQIANDSVGLLQLAGIARGKLIIGDTSGDPSVLAPGSADQILKSDGTDIAWGSDEGKTAEEIQDIAGAMFTSNTETGITATYQDGDGTIDLVVGTLNQDTTGTADLITATANNSTNETVYPVFVDGATGSQGAETDTGLTYNPSTGMLTATGVTATVTGNITGDVTGNTSGTAATVTTAAQTNITSLGTLTALTVDDVAVDGKVITMTGSSGDTATVTVGTNGTLDITTTDTAAAAANIQITADGTAELAGTTVTLDSAGGVTIDADGGTITFADGGSSLGTITSSGYTGDVVGDVTGNADTATALATGRTIGMTGDVVWTSPSFTGSGNVTAAGTIQSDAVEQSMIADDAVGADQLATNAVVAASIVAGSVTTTEIAANTIATGNIADNAIDSTKIAQNSILTRHIDDGQVTSDQLAGSVANAKLANSTITLSDGSNTTATALGGTMTFSGTANEVTVAESSGTVTIGLPDDVTIAGDLTVAGDTTTVNTATLAVEDPLVALATGNNAADAVDIGLYGLYDTSGSQDLYAGLFRDASDSGKWKLFKDNQAAPTTTVNVSGTGYATGTLVANLEGNVTGNVTGNTSGTAATVTTAAQTNITSLGTLTALTVDNLGINGNTITANSGAVNITPAGGSAIVLDGAINVDAGVVTGATSITSTAFVGDITGDVTGNVDTFTATANNSANETVYPVFVDGATGAQGAETDTGLTYNPSSGTLTSTVFVGALTGNVTGNVSGTAGSATGNAATATALATARNIGGTSFDGTGNIAVALSTEATNVTVSANNSTDETVYPVFVDGATSTQGIESDTGFTYNPSSGTLTSTVFVGALTGNVTGNVSGTAGSATGNAATATALATARTIGGTSFDGTANIVPATVTVADTTDTSAYVALFDSATGDLGPKTDAGITYNAGTGMLTATGLTGPLTGTLQTAAQTNITSVGTLTALQVDNININDNSITSTNSNGNISLTPHGTGNVVLNTDNLSIVGTAEGATVHVLAGEAENATIILSADESDDNGDDWQLINAASNNALTFRNDISGSAVAQVTLTPHATVASSTTAIAGGATVGGTLGVTGLTTLTGNLTMMSNTLYANQAYVHDRVGHLNDADTYIDFAVDTIVFAAGGERMRITSDGDVGIGCTPGSGTRLEVRDSANSAIMELSGTDGRGLKLFTRKQNYPTDSGQNDAAVVYDAQDTEHADYPQHIFQTGGTTRMQINASGITTPAGTVSSSNIVTSAPSSGSGKNTGHVWYVV